MKKLLFILFVVWAFNFTEAFAGDTKEVVKFGPYNNINTNTSLAVTNAPDGDRFYYGDFMGIYIDLGGAASPTVTVSLVTDGGTGSGPTRTLFSKEVAADGWYPVRELVYSSAGAAATDFWSCIPVYQDKLNLIYTYANKTNVNVTAHAYFK